MRTHYPRTPHLPWSPGASSDDVRLTGRTDLAGLTGSEVVVTEKMDGENTTLYADGLHARSLDSAHHPSRARVKALQGRVGPHVPAGWRICGENVFARHSIPYDDLAAHFYGFSVWDGDTCLGWDRTVAFLHGLGIPTPPVLWRGVFDARAERTLRALRLDTGRQEGYVVRPAGSFPAAEFGRRVAKWVRPGHVVTDTHWMHAAVVENALGPSAALWDVRSGAPVDPVALAVAASAGAGDAPAGSVAAAAGSGDAPAARAAADALDALSLTGDDRLSGVLAALLHRTRRAALAPALAGPLGMPLARRIADLVGLAPRCTARTRTRSGAADWRGCRSPPGCRCCTRWPGPWPRARRPASRWSGRGCTPRRWASPTGSGRRSRSWSPMPRSAAWRRPVRRTRWAGSAPRRRRWRRPGGGGTAASPSAPPGRPVRQRQEHLRPCPAGHRHLYLLDDLRLARGSRADQSANADVLREGLRRLDEALVPGATVVWDATSLNPHQRSLVHAVAHRRDALLTHAVAWTGEDELTARNARRAHPVPPEVLDSQLRRFVPPYPGQAHRTWYIGSSTTVEDRA